MKCDQCGCDMQEDYDDVDDGRGLQRALVGFVCLLCGDRVELCDICGFAPCGDHASWCPEFTRQPTLPSFPVP